MLDEKFEPVKAILLNTNVGDYREISLDISTKTSEVMKYLEGPATFIGQWEELEIVIMKNPYAVVPNEHILKEPFDTETHCGPILLVRMDHEAHPRDLTLEECLESKLFH
jgi:hypothetical protein